VLTIIALTAYARKGDRERFISGGFNDVPKPVDVKEFMTALEKYNKEGEYRDESA
jgi:CheY-like chemotaxis protein